MGYRKKLDTLKKYQKVLELFDVKQFNEGSQIYQDASLSIQIRNELTHYKPGSFTVCKSKSQKITGQHPLTYKLKGKFPTNPLISSNDNSYFPDKCLGSPCAIWVAQSVEEFADEFFIRLGVVPHYQHYKIQQDH